MSSSSNRRKRPSDQEESSSNNSEVPNATTYLIDRIVATDLARGDQKEKLRISPKNGASGVIMKKRSPLPSTNPQQQQHSWRSQHDSMLEEKHKERELRRAVLQQRNRESSATPDRPHGSTPLASQKQQQQPYPKQNEKHRSVGGKRVGSGAKQPQQRLAQCRTTEDERIKERAKAPSMARAIPPYHQPKHVASKRQDERFQQRAPSLAAAVPQPAKHPSSNLPSSQHRDATRAEEEERMKQRAKVPSMAEAIPQGPYRMRRESKPLAAVNRPVDQAEHKQHSTSSTTSPTKKREALQQRGRLSPMKQQLSVRTKDSANSEGSNTSLLDEIMKHRARASAIACAIGGQKTVARSKQQRSKGDTQQVSKLPGGKEHTHASSKDPKKNALPISSLQVVAADDGDDTTLSAMDDENSDDAAYALAMARSSMRQRLEKEKQQQSGGVAVAVPHAPSTAKSSRPSLAPAVDPHAKNGSTSRDETDDAFSADDEEDDCEEDVEAHAGIPLVLPGAFAVQGPDQRDSQSDNSSVCSYASQSVDYFTPPLDNDNDNDEERPSSFSGAAMLDAEVCEQYVGHELQSVDTKVSVRFRCMQIAACFLFLFGVASSLWIGLSWRKPAAAKTMPEVEGWVALDSHPEASGEKQRTFFGRHVALSAEGDLVVVASPGWDSGEEFNVGQVTIFKERIARDVGTKWETVAVLEGPGPSRSEATTLAMTQEGRTIAVGHPLNRARSQVVLYEETQYGEWEQLVDPLYGGSNSSWFGHSLSISGDGSLLAIGAPLEDTTNGSRSGAVHMLRRATNGIWLNGLSQQLFGSSENEYFGWSIDVSNDGQYVAVGAPVSDDTTGRARVYHWDGVGWVQVGDDIVGDVPLGRFGESLSLSSDGSVLAIGARGSTIEPGFVAVYRLSTDETWNRDADAEFVGHYQGESFGSSVSLSGDGSVLAVGGPRSFLFGEESGVVRVYRWVDGKWIQDGSSVGSDGVLSFGSSVALARDGERILIGAPRTTYESSIQQAGAVRVFDRDASVL